MYQGDTVKTHADKTWAECADLCNALTTCNAFSYHTVSKNCFLKSKSTGEPVYKENFVHSRRCGSTEFDCPKASVKISYINYLTK